MAEPFPSTDQLVRDLRWLQRLARSLVRDPHGADDAVQDAMVAALRRGPTAPRRPWLGAVLRNAVRQERRSARRRGEREARAPRRDAERSTLDAVAELSLQRRVVEAVRALDEPFREAIVLRFLHGLAPREVAARVGVPVKTVHSRVERGLARLRARLDREAGGREAWLALLAPLAGTPEVGATALVGAASVSAAAKVAAGAALLTVAATLWVGRPIERPAERSERAAPAIVAATLDARDGLGPAPPAPEEAEREPVELVAGRASPQRFRRGLDPSRVDGEVLDLEGRPVAGALVRLRPESGGEGPFEATTDAQGRFGFERRVAGRLEVEAPGLIAVHTSTVTARPRSSWPERILVAPRGAFAGVVVDPDGRPVPSAEIELTLADDALGVVDVGGRTLSVPLPLARMRTDELGAFAFEPAPFLVGAVLRARRAGLEPAVSELHQPVRLDLRLALGRLDPELRVLHGLVLDRDGGPVEGAFVSLGGVAAACSEADGRFVLAAEAWETRGVLRAAAPGRLPAVRDLAQEDELVGADASRPLELRLGGPALAIRGRVVDGDGRPVPDVDVWTVDVRHFGQVVVEAYGRRSSRVAAVEDVLGDGLDRLDRLVAAPTDSEGLFELSGLLDGEYALFAVSTRTLAGAGPIAARGGDADVVIEIDGQAPRRVAGRVVSSTGEPLEGVTVKVGRYFDVRTAPRPDEPWGTGPLQRGRPQWYPLFGQTDADGRFAFEDVRVDRPTVFLLGGALTLGEQHDYGPDDDLERLEIVVAATTCSFRVELVDPGEADQVGLLDADGRLRPIFVWADRTRFAVPLVRLVEGRSGSLEAPSGRYELLLYRGGSPVRRSPVTLAPAEEELVLRP